MIMEAVLTVMLILTGFQIQIKMKLTIQVSTLHKSWYKTHSENDSEGGMSEISNTNPNKKRRIMNLSQTEEEALNLLNPF